MKLCTYATDQPLPRRLSGRDMCALFGITHSTFYRWVAAGRFDWAELKPKIGARAWAGALVEQYLRGDLAGIASTPRRRKSDTAITKVSRSAEQVEQSKGDTLAHEATR